MTEPIKAYYCKTCANSPLDPYRCYHCKNVSKSRVCPNCAYKNKQCMTCGGDVSYKYKQSYEEPLKKRIRILEREISMLRRMMDAFD